MRNGTEIRPNGLKITKKQKGRIAQYHVAGSKNGPWDYLRNARKDADEMLGTETVIDAMQCGATHYDTFWGQWLMVRYGALYYRSDAGGWALSNHKDGINAVNNGECINLEVRLGG